LQNVAVFEVFEFKTIERLTQKVTLWHQEAKDQRSPWTGVPESTPAAFCFFSGPDPRSVCMLVCTRSLRGFNQKRNEGGWHNYPGAE